MNHKKAGIVAVIICFLFFSYCKWEQETCLHSIQVDNAKDEPWHGWLMKFNLDEITSKHPSLLATHLSYTEAKDDPLYWLSGEGTFFFYDICAKKHLFNFFQINDGSYVSAPYPHLYTDRKNYLRTFGGNQLREGTYYINNYYLTNSGVPRYCNLVGYFIEIKRNAWRIGCYDLKNKIIYSVDNQKAIKEHPNKEVLSPWLPFGEYLIKDKSYPTIYITVR